MKIQEGRPGELNDTVIDKKAIQYTIIRPFLVLLLRDGELVHEAVDMALWFTQHLKDKAVKSVVDIITKEQVFSHTGKSFNEMLESKEKPSEGRENASLEMLARLLLPESVTKEEKENVVKLMTQCAKHLEGNDRAIPEAAMSVLLKMDNSDSLLKLVPLEPIPLLMDSSEFRHILVTRVIPFRAPDSNFIRRLCSVSGVSSSSYVALAVFAAWCNEPEVQSDLVDLAIAFPHRVPQVAREHPSLLYAATVAVKQLKDNEVYFNNVTVDKFLIGKEQWRRDVERLIPVAVKWVEEGNTCAKEGDAATRETNMWERALRNKIEQKMGFSKGTLTRKKCLDEIISAISSDSSDEGKDEAVEGKRSFGIEEDLPHKTSPTLVQQEEEEKENKPPPRDGEWSSHKSRAALKSMHDEQRIGELEAELKRKEDHIARLMQQQNEEKEKRNKQVQLEERVVSQSRTKRLPKGYEVVHNIAKEQDSSLNSVYDTVLERLGAVAQQQSDGMRYDTTTRASLERQLIKWSPHQEGEKANELKGKSNMIPLDGVQTLLEMTRGQTYKALSPQSDAAAVDSLLEHFPTHGPFEEEDNSIRQFATHEVQESLESVSQSSMKVKKTNGWRKEKEEDIVSVIRDVSTRMFKDKKFKASELKKRGEKARELIQKYCSWMSDPDENDAMQMLREAREKGEHSLQEHRDRTNDGLKRHEDRILESQKVVEELEHFARDKEDDAEEEEAAFNAQRVKHSSNIDQALELIKNGFEGLASSLEQQQEHEAKLQKSRAEAKAASSISRAWVSQWKSEEQALVKEQERLKEGFQFFEKFYKWYTAFIQNLMKMAEENEKSKQEYHSEYRTKMLTLVKALRSQLLDQQKATEESINHYQYDQQKAAAEWRACMNTSFLDEEEDEDDDDETTKSLRQMQKQKEENAKKNLDALELLEGKMEDELERLEGGIKECDDLVEKYDCHVEAADTASSSDQDWVIKGQAQDTDDSTEEGEDSVFDADKWAKEFFPPAPRTFADASFGSAPQAFPRASRRDSRATSITSFDNMGYTMVSPATPRDTPRGRED